MKEDRKNQDKIIEFSIVVIFMLFSMVSVISAYRLTTLETQVERLEKQIQK